MVTNASDAEEGKYTLEEMITLEIEAGRGENVDGKLERGGRDDEGSSFGVVVCVCVCGGGRGLGLGFGIYLVITR